MKPHRVPFSRIIAAILGYGMYLFSNLMFILLLPLLLVFASLSTGLRKVLFGSVYRSYLYFLTHVYLPAFRNYQIIEESGFEEVRDGTPCIFVANHRSRIDGLFLLSILKKTGVIMKANYARLPVFSSLVKYTDFISVDSSSVETLAAAMDRCKELISRGDRLLVFPEGSRSRSAKLLPFKELAFRLAIETRVPVIPVIVHSAHPFMAKMPGSLIPPKDMPVVIRALEPVLPLERERAVEFAERVRRRMMAEIKKLDAGTVWETLHQKQ